MKKLLAILLCVFSIHFVKAQISLIDENGNTISDGQQFTFGTTSENPAKLHFYIKNTSSQEVGIKGEIVEITGADGSNVQFCLGQCLYSVEEGTIVPENENQDIVTFNIPANSTSQGPGTYFWNKDSSSDLITYSFKIYQVNSLGNQIGDDITINYTYDSSLSTSTEELNNLGVNIYNTIASEEINLQTSENINAVFYDLNGKKVFEKSLQNGNQSINISMLNAGIYLVQFNNQAGNKATTKIIKK